MHITDKCDVYSFGVVALEMMMGKHPGELLSCVNSGSSKSLSDIDDDAEKLLLKDVLDCRLPTPRGEVAAAVVRVVMLALACTLTSPQSRPNMRFVVHKLSQRNKTLTRLAHPIDLITINNLYK